MTGPAQRMLLLNCGGPVVLSWWCARLAEQWCRLQRSQLNCTAVRLVPRANPVFSFLPFFFIHSLRARGLFLCPLGRLGQSGAVMEVRDITGRFLAAILGSPCCDGVGGGVDLRCLQRKRQSLTGADLLFICFAVYAAWSVPGRPLSVLA